MENTILVNLLDQAVLEEIAGKIENLQYNGVVGGKAKYSYEFQSTMEGYQRYMMENGDDMEDATIEGLSEVCANLIRNNEFNDDLFSLNIKKA